MNINTETGDKNKKPVTKKVITYNTKLMILFFFIPPAQQSRSLGGVDLLRVKHRDRRHEISGLFGGHLVVHQNRAGCHVHLPGGSVLSAFLADLGFQKEFGGGIVDLLVGGY